LHRAALRAALAGEYPAAERLFERATVRYAEDYEPIAHLRLSAQRRVFRQIARAASQGPTSA
jgi:hypothetical protein